MIFARSAMRSWLGARSALVALLLVTLFAGGLRGYALSSPGTTVWDEWFYARREGGYGGNDQRRADQKARASNL